MVPSLVALTVISGRVAILAQPTWSFSSHVAAYDETVGFAIKLIAANTLESLKVTAFRKHTRVIHNEVDTVKSRKNSRGQL